MRSTALPPNLRPRISVLLAASLAFTAAMLMLKCAIAERAVTHVSLYDGLLCGMHGLALTLLFCPIDRRWLLLFAGLQPLIFPLAWIATPLLVLSELVAAIRQTGVFEDFSEPPFGLAAQVAWLVTTALCVGIAWPTKSPHTEPTTRAA